MRITESVIQDLLPLYLAEEASADTRVLIEGYLAEHPDLAGQVAAARRWRLPSPNTAAESYRLEGERRALERTKRLLRRRSVAMGFAIAFSMLPLSFGSYDERGLHFIFWPDHVGAAVVSLLLGLICWLLFFHLDRQLRPRGF